MAVDAQDWDPPTYARNARFVADLGVAAFDWLEPRAGERILDLGCGDGVLTRRLADLGCRVTGVDASPSFIDTARAAGLDARVMDGQDLRFAAEFDAVFSNAALHWMRRADRVIDGVWRALVPGGRFVAEFGGAGNIAAIRAALEGALTRRGVNADPCNPWYFPDAPAYSALLEARGFEVQRCESFDRPTPLPGDLRGWLETFARSYLAAVPAARRRDFLGEVQDKLAPVLRRADGIWWADYVRLRILAFKPAAG